MPMRTYWPGTWPGPVGAGLDHEGGGVLGLGRDRDDPAAQLGAGAQRVEHVEVVGRDERGRGQLGDPERALAQAGEAATPVRRARGARKVIEAMYSTLM